MPSFLTGRFSRRSASNAKTRSVRSTRLTLEQLEARLVPVVGIGFTPPLAGHSPLLDSVGYVELEHGLFGHWEHASAVLLSDHLHILTAAHIFSSTDGGPPDPSLKFDISFAENVGTFKVTGVSAGDSAHVQFAPGWNGDYVAGNDLAVITLDAPAPSWVPGFDIYSGANEVGQQFLIVGYGRYGEGVDRYDSGEKHFGYNTFTTQAGSDADPTLAGTYDPTLGRQQSELQYGLIAKGQAGAASGDSGCPLFIGNQIAGITSYLDDSQLNPGPIDPLPAEVGTIEYATRISAYSRWIDEVTGRSRNLVFDTSSPFLAKNTALNTVNVEADAAGQNLILTFDGNYVIDSCPLRRLDSITVINSANLQYTITVDPRLNLPVTVQGGGNDELIVSGFHESSDVNYQFDSGTVSAAGVHGTTPISYTGIGELQLYTQNGGANPANPSSVVINDVSAPNVSVNTAGGDFSIAVAGGLQTKLSLTTGSGTSTIAVDNVPTGGVSIHTGVGATRITVGDSDPLAPGQVDISGPGQNTLTIDDSGDQQARSVVIGSQTVTFGDRIPGSPATTTFSFEEDFLDALVVKTGTAYQFDRSDPFGGTSVVVQDTPSRPFGPTAVTLYCGQGNTGVLVQALSSGLSVIGQGGQDTVTVGANNSLAGIRASLGVSNHGGTTQLYVEGSADNYNHTVTIGSTPDFGDYIEGLAPAPIVFDHTGIGGVSLATGTGTDTFNIVYAEVPTTITAAGLDYVNVTSTGPNGSLDLNLGAGRNYVTVGTGYGLNEIQGGIVLGATGSNILYIDDRTPLAGPLTQDSTNATLLGYGFFPAASAPILFANVDTLIVWGGSGSNTFDIADTPANAYTTLYTGDRATVDVTGTTGTLFVNPPAGGLETVTIGGPEHGLDPIQGPVWLSGDAGMSVIVDDSGATTPQMVTIDQNSLTRSGAAVIHYPYAGDFPLFFDGGSGGNTIDVQGARGNVTILTGTGNDAVTLGSAAGTLSNLGHIIVNTAAGGSTDVYLLDRGETANQDYEFGSVSNEPFFSDIPVFTCAGTTVVLAELNGDTVAASPVAVVALLGGSGSNTVNISDAWAADNVAVDAGSGSNTINGGTGRELLIGGGGVDAINGGSGQDILVAGSVSFGTASDELTALTALMAEWGRTDADYATRVSDLLFGGGLNGSTVLNPSTFVPDGGGTTLTGGVDLNLFFGSLTNDFSNYDPTSGATFVDPATFQAPTTINATALAGGRLFLDGNAYDSTAALSLYLRPGGHTLQGVGGDAIAFTVNLDGTVSYDPSLEGILTGGGTGILAINGASVTVDATALAGTSFFLDGAAYDPTTPFSVNLLPGSHTAQTANGTTISFTVALDGTIGYDPALAGVLAGLGGNTLTLSGALAGMS